MFFVAIKLLISLLKNLFDVTIWQLALLILKLCPIVLIIVFQQIYIIDLFTNNPLKVQGMQIDRERKREQRFELECARGRREKIAYFSHKGMRSKKTLGTQPYVIFKHESNREGVHGSVKVCTHTHKYIGSMVWIYGLRL